MTWSLIDSLFQDPPFLLPILARVFVQKVSNSLWSKTANLDHCNYRCDSQGERDNGRQGWSMVFSDPK